MTSTIQQSLIDKKPGFHIGHRLVLPFKCQVIKLVFDSEIYTEMEGGKNIYISHSAVNTSIYLRSAGKLSSRVGTYERIKMVVCELDADICEMTNHIKLICEIKDDHQIKIHIPEADDLFIE